MSASPTASTVARRATLFRRIRGWLGVGSPADWVFQQVCRSASLIVILLVFLMVVLLGLQAWPAFESHGLSVVTGTTWDPAAEAGGPPQLGGLTFVYGSILTSLLAMLIAVPLGVGTAAYLSEIAPGPIKRLGSFLVELLAAIPSVVYGFWGISVLAPWMQSLFNLVGGPNIGGKSILTASIILAVMVVPYVAAVAYDVCQAVPRTQREGSLALGATRWQTIWSVVLPYASPGIIGGCFLALGRAIGETIAVTMLIGNSTQIQWLPFGQGATIPSVIALELPNTNRELHSSALIQLGLLLFVVTIVLNVLARLLIWRVGTRQRGFSMIGRLILGRQRPGAAEISSDSEPNGEVRPFDTPRRVPAPLPSNPRAKVVDWLMTGVLALCLAITCGPLFLILGYITVRGVGAFNSPTAVWDFFTALPKPQGEMGGGLANGLAGSVILVALATLVALPIGLLAAIFLAEYRNSRLVPVVRFFGELLNGVPSIVVGTFVVAFVVMLIRFGFLPRSAKFSGWAGACALAVMMIPIVMRASEEALKLVPQTLRNASHALGAHYWQTVLRVTVPAALPAIITGTFLAIARIAGETAPLLLTILGSEYMDLSPSGQMPALPLYIFYYAGSPYDDRIRMAWAAALVLLTFVMVLNVGIRLITGNRVVQASRSE
jgi:phosphate transport system permease protein